MSYGTSRIRVINYQGFNLSNDKGCHLKWSSRMGYPRISVFLGDSIKDKETGKVDYSKLIIAPFPWKSLVAFLGKALKDVVKDNKVDYVETDRLNNKFVDNIRQEEIEMQASVKIGKSKDNQYYIAIKGKDTEYIYFYMQNTDKYEKFRNSNKQELKLNNDRNQIVLYLEVLIDTIKKDIQEFKTEKDITNNIKNTNTTTTTMDDLV